MRRQLIYAKNGVITVPFTLSGTVKCNKDKTRNQYFSQEISSKRFKNPCLAGQALMPRSRYFGKRHRAPQLAALCPPACQ